MDTSTPVYGIKVRSLRCDTADIDNSKDAAWRRFS